MCIKESKVLFFIHIEYFRAIFTDLAYRLLPPKWFLFLSMRKNQHFVQFNTLKNARGKIPLSFPHPHLSTAYRNRYYSAIGREKVSSVDLFCRQKGRGSGRGGGSDRSDSTLVVPMPMPDLRSWPSVKKRIWGGATVAFPELATREI